jgi:hypothetical protein
MGWQKYLLLVLATALLAACAGQPLREDPGTVIAGALTPEQVQQTFDRYRKDFQILYDARRNKDDPTEHRPPGTVLLSFELRPDGLADDVLIEKSTLNDPDFEKTVVDKLLRMKFQQSGGATHILRYPINFI